MTVPTTTAPIKRAVVQALRGNTTLKAGVSGFHEAFAPKKAAYPFLVYQLVYSPYDYLWGSVLIYAGIDIRLYSKNSVEANNLDALVAETLHDASLSVDGQSTLICRRVADLSFADIDEEGTKIYMVGGTYVIMTDQPI